MKNSIRYLIYSTRWLAAKYWLFRARIQFLARRVNWPEGLRVLGPLGLSASGIIELGRNITIVNDSKYNRAGICHPTQLVAAPGATLTIGDHVGISGASIYAKERIEIGNHVLIGVNCHVYDNDFHPVDWQQRRVSKDSESAPIIIMDDVWLCANVTVLKGVTIGARTIIAAGSVVTGDIPADCVAGGIPAQVIRSFETDR